MEILIIDDCCKDLHAAAEAFEGIAKEYGFSADCTLCTGVKEVSFGNVYDLAVIDIELKETSGFHLAQLLKERFPDLPIIFCTNHKELVFEAFALDIFFFVRKENMEEDVRMALRKYLNHMQKKTRRFTCTVKDKVYSVPFSLITHVSVYGNNLSVHAGKDSVSLRMTLQKFLQEAPEEFVRASRSCAVNLTYIKTIDREKLVLKYGEEIWIGRSQYEKVRAAFLKDLARRNT